MKVGIVTFHGSHNYGAMLQAFALKNYVEKLNYEGSVIDYKTEKMINDYKIFKLSSKLSIKQKLIISLNIFVYPKLKKRWNKFEEFSLENFNLTKRYKSVKEVQEEKFEFNALICGSDQVWNPKGRADAIYMLDFCNNQEINKISYAPSFGKSEIPKEREEEYKKKISKIHHISVRESSGLEIVKNVIGREAVVVADPVFLLSKDEWSGSAESVDYSEPFILCYFTYIPFNIQKTIDYYREETGYKIYMLHDRFFNKIKVDKIIRDAGPKDFLNLFNKASFIITTSFHGTAFSIINKKPFISIEHDNSDSRVIDLLKKTNLSNRYVNTASSFEIKLLELDYSGNEKYINDFIEDSKGFLSDSLSK